jgi:osmotically-inducible protein OsmY
MRTYLTTAAIAGLLLLGVQSVASAQSSSNRNTSSSSTRSAGSTTTGNSMSVAGQGTSSRQSTNGRGSNLSLLGNQIQDIQISSSPLQSGEFVGADVQDVRNTMARTGAERGTGQGMSGLSAFGSSPFGRALQALSGGMRSSSGARRTTEVRARIITGFKVSQPAPAQLSSSLAQRLEQSSWIQANSPMEVKMEGGTAILRGAVATEHDRELAARMAMLEPGVRKVDNQLVVQPVASPSPSAAPAVQ